MFGIRIIWLMLKVIKGGETPRPHRKENPDDAEMMHCPNCDMSVFEIIIINPRRRNLKWDKRTGEKKLRCVDCKVICG